MSEIEIPETKLCKYCRKYYEKSEFKPRTTPDGLGNTCRLCRNARQKVRTAERSPKKIQQKEKRAPERTRMMSEEGALAVIAILPELKRLVKSKAISYNLEWLKIDYQDVLQDAVYNMLTARKQPPVEEVRPWARKVVTTAAYYAAVGTEPTDTLDELYMGVPDTSVDYFREMEELLPAVIASLPKRQRSVMEGVLDGQTAKQQAARTGLSVGCIQSTGHLAKAKIKRLLSPR